MGLDQDQMKQLLVMFRAELDEQTQLITNGLLKLEKGIKDANEKSNLLESIFRAAHNIKGASRGLGIEVIGDIAHHLETIFFKIKNNSIAMTKQLIDLCLNAVDKMPIALKSFTDETPLNFDLNTLLKQLELDQLNESAELSVNPKEVKPVLGSEVKGTDESVRIPINKIDKVFALLEEIQINKIAIDGNNTEMNQLSTKISEFYSLWKQLYDNSKVNKKNDYHDMTTRTYESANDFVINTLHAAQHLQKSMQTQLSSLDILANSLQDEIRMLRLIPASNLLHYLTRYARDLTHELNKEVEVIIHGEDVRMDRLILSGLYDPLIHLIRNAIDHGIESPQIRESIGKPKSGRIKIDVIAEANKIHMMISDDGAGIDIQKIKKVIEEKKFASPTEIEKMTEQEIIDFIFRSGFSTKPIITDVSGRGVGLDVVKANLTDLKGNVSVTTKLGKGTTFVLTVPLTLSSERGLLIKLNDQIYVIPSHAIKSVLITESNNISEVEGSQTVMINDQPIPLRLLSDILSLQTQGLIKKDKLSLVIMEKEWQKIAFVVDEIVGEREIVIKPLKPPLMKIEYIDGGTLLEQNQLALVLNPNDLLNQAYQTRVNQRLVTHEESLHIKSKPHILVVDDSITTRTLEKNILESKNYQVTVAVNGKEAWEILQKQSFSLIVTDVSMPVMDGFTLTEKIKKSDKWHDLPVIIVTSLGSDSEKARGVEVGANAYIVKNEFESGVLLDIVEQLV